MHNPNANYAPAVLIFLLLAWLPACVLSGCDRIQANTAEAIAMQNTKALIDKLPIDKGSVTATGSVQDPDYVIDGFYCMGFHGNIRLRGMTVNAAIAGNGERPPTTQPRSP